MSKRKLKLPGGGLGGGVLAVVGVLVGLAGALFFFCTFTVDPDQFAVKQVYFGPGKGIQETIYGPGTHIVIPGYERLHVLPRDLQLLDFNDAEFDAHYALREDRLAAPSIGIQTSDGYQVLVDATVMYRVDNPHTVITKVGVGRLYEDQIVVKRADQILREVLGKLDAEDFYDDRVRMASANEARTILTQRLDEWGIKVWTVLVRHYKYDERFQSIIEAKKIEDQRLYKNQAESLREQKRAEMNQIVATWQAKIDVVKQEGATRVRQIAADGDRYYRELVASGQKEIGLAQADGARWEREALEAAGSSNLVGLEMANALDGIEVIVVPTTGRNGMNPLDLDALLEGW